MISPELRRQLNKARDIIDAMITAVIDAPRVNPAVATHLSNALVSLTEGLNELDAALKAGEPVPPSHTES